MRDGQVLLTYLHLAADKRLTEELLAAGPGFTPVGDVFDEDGIPHIAMVRPPR